MFYLIAGLTMLTFILIEAMLYRPILRKNYPWREGLSAIAVTVGNQASQVIYALIPLYVFSFFYDLRLLDYEIKTPLHYFLLFLLVDFSYYWGHRLSHHVRWMWASHSVHHSPNEMTLATSYQLAWTAWLSGEWLLWIPFLLLGINPEIGMEIMTMSLLYQFWLHTELVPKTRIFGWIFNNPSAHRVHHASNSEYINKNFGGVLIIFDRIFGTYQPEMDHVKIKYGLTTPVTSLNPFTIAFAEWKVLFADLAQTKGFWEKLKVALEDPATAHQRKSEVIVLPVGNRSAG